jgi:hypothetical protein
MDPNQDDEPPEEIADDEEPRALNALPLQTREHPLALPGTQNVMRRFNRTTMWVATGFLSTVIFAALVLAVQERHPMAANLAEEARQTSGELLPNASPAVLSEVVVSSGKSTDEIIPGQATSSDHGFTPEINHPEVQANVSSWSTAQRQDSARVIRPNIPNVRYRSSYRTDPSSGADFAGPRTYLRNCGFDTQLVEVEEDGTIEPNAAFIDEAVRKETSDGKRLTIVNTSIGGPQTAVAPGKLLSVTICGQSPPGSVSAVFWAGPF